MVYQKCGFSHTKKNGSTYNKKQKYQCNDYKHQFIDNPKKNKISDEKKELIDRLLLEKIPLAGIARAIGVSERWLQKYVNEKYIEIQKIINISEKPKGKTTIQCDELWSFFMLSPSK